MKSFLHALLLSAVLPAAAVAQTTPAPAAPAAPAATPTRDADPALWVVRDDDTTVYLFGTVHVLKPGLSWFDEGVRQAFDASDTLALELVEPEAAEMQRLIGSVALDRSGRPISARLTAAQRERLAAHLAGVGAPANAIDPFEPWFAATMLSLMSLPKLGYDPASGVEPQLSAAARSAGKPIVALETAEQQLGFFDGLSEPAQMAMLTAAIEDFEEVGPLLDEMIVEWGAGDPVALAETMNDQLADQPEVQRTLLTDRNARWAAWIAERMATPGTVFVAVGAGHLAGENSVQDELADRELVATRVDY